MRLIKYSNLCLSDYPIVEDSEKEENVWEWNFNISFYLNDAERTTSYGAERRKLLSEHGAKVNVKDAVWRNYITQS